MTQTDTEQTIIQMQTDWIEAWLGHDEAALDRFVADDFVITTAGKGLRESKRQWIDGSMARYAPKSFKYGDMQVRVFPDAAVVVWQYTEETTGDLLARIYGGSVEEHSQSDTGPDIHQVTFLLTDVWIKRGGQWQVVSRHASMPATAVRGAGDA